MSISPPFIFGKSLVSGLISPVGVVVSLNFFSVNCLVNESFFDAWATPFSAAFENIPDIPAIENCATELKPNAVIATVPVLNGSYLCSGLTSISVYCLAISAPPSANESTLAVVAIPFTPALNAAFFPILPISPVAICFANCFLVKFLIDSAAAFLAAPFAT